MSIEEFLSHLRDESLPAGVVNVVKPPADGEEIDAWQSERPEFPLPADYRSLLQAANGFAMRSSDDSPNGMLRMLPIAEVRPLAQQLMDLCGLDEEDLTDPPTCLMVGEDQDSQWCLALDTATGRYLEVGYNGGSTEIGTLPETLDWLVERAARWNR